ncbi:MAG: Bug family tripartite tricarboxylate transporter substrate binding protein [Stellaceae bacterium]
MQRLSRWSAEIALAAVLLAGTVAAASPAWAQWKPSGPITFVVPAGKGGGADQMARKIADIAQKEKFVDWPMNVVNEGAGAGAQGFLDVKGDDGDAQKIVITLSNLFTTPLSTGVPFRWTDLTPVAMLALDEFVLWVNADTPYRTSNQYLAAVRAAPGKFKMYGTGAKQEDQIVTSMIEAADGVKFTYVPSGGGGTVAKELIGKRADSSVNNPIEALDGWREGKLRPLCVFDAKRMDYREAVAQGKSWYDVPTCKSQGLDVQYLMLRGIFLPPEVGKDAVTWYVDFLKRVRATDDWKKFVDEAAFNPSFMTGADYVKWLQQAEALHKELMAKAGFLASTN